MITSPTTTIIIIQLAQQSFLQQDFNLVGISIQIISSCRQPNNKQTFIQRQVVVCGMIAVLYSKIIVVRQL